jgi:hypothetical protein
MILVCNAEEVGNSLDLVSQAAKKFSALYGTWTFVTLFTRICHWILSWARLTQSVFSQLVSFRCILISFSRVHQNLASGLFLSGFPTESCIDFSCLRRAMCLTNLTVIYCPKICD